MRIAQRLLAGDVAIHETEVLGVMMEEEMRKFLDEELPCHIVAAINSLCKAFSFIKSSSNVTLSFNAVGYDKIQCFLLYQPCWT